MNDFTKEELQVIHLDMTTYINRTTILAESPSHKELRDKIQAMIDNYCENVLDEECTHNKKIRFLVNMPGSYDICLNCGNIRHVR